MDGPVGIASPTSTWTLDAAYAYATKRAVPPADPNGEPLYNCPFPQCAKQFSKRFNLKAHLRVHTGDKPFACSFQGCNRRFMWKSSLTSHQNGHSRRKQELQKRNAVMAGKALAAESVVTAANMAMRSSAPFTQYPDQYHHPHQQQQPTQHHHQHTQQHQYAQPSHSQPPQQPPFHHQQHHHQQQHQQHPRFHQQQQPQQHHPPPLVQHHQPEHQAPPQAPHHVRPQLPQKQAPPQPHRQVALEQQPNQPAHFRPPSLSQHPETMYGNIPNQQQHASHPADQGHTPISQPRQAQPSASVPFGHHRLPSSEPSPALSYITAEDGPNASSGAPRTGIVQAHHQSQLHRKRQEQHHIPHHPPPHLFQRQQKRPPGSFLESRQHQEAPISSKQPRHHADSSVQRPSSSRPETQSQRTSLASQRSFNHEHSSGSGTVQAPPPQFMRNGHDEAKSLAAQRADQQKLLQEQGQQLEREEQQIKRQQRLLRQKQEQHEEQQRRLQLQEQQERQGPEVEQRQRHVTHSVSHHGAPPTVSESLLNRTPAPIEHRQDAHIPFQRVEDTSRGFRPSQRAALPSLTQTLTPLNGLGRSDVGGHPKSDAPTPLPKPSHSTLASPASLGLGTGSILPSPTASLGLTRSPNGFSQQFLFPSHATSPTWATTPTVPPVSMTLASPKAPPTPNSLMDVRMASLHSDHHAGDMSPVPSEVAISPGLHSPVPPPMLPQIPTNTRPRRPLSHPKPPLAGPILSTGSSALLPPLTNVAPANPPTHIDLRGVLEDEGPNCSLPALGSPHTDMSPLPVASPIFGSNGNAPLSPMQPYSPFSGIQSTSAKAKPSMTW